MADGIKLSLGRRDMSTFRTDDVVGKLVRAHVARRHPVPLCLLRAAVGGDQGNWMRDVIDVVLELTPVRVDSTTGTSPRML